jgi:hypothetical protein
MRFPAWLTVLAMAASPARADPPGLCHVVAIDFLPTDQLQIAAWIEKPDGTWVDTIYLTQKTGLYGLGNRPGRFDFNSGPTVNDLWPYGRRITVLPVWASRRAVGTGQTFPMVVFQDGDENNLSHPFDQSSMEHTPPYCRPMQPTEPQWDAGTCASQMAFTDKGIFATDGRTSLYPPRADVLRNAGTDSPSVDQYRQVNPFDAIPGTFEPGDYIAWIEVNKAFDYNDTYNATTYPPPAGIPWTMYGKPYRGQPSVIYKVPFTLGSTETIASVADYAGYGDPNGVSGTMHAPDPTITTAGSRLQIIPGTSDRVEVDARPEMDVIAPGGIGALQLASVTSSDVAFQFTAPGDDGQTGNVTGYDVRVRTTAMTEDNFEAADSMKVATSVPITAPGARSTVDVPGLLPETEYWIGIRAYDECRNDGPLGIIHVITLARPPGYVDACFVATAAYGSRMASDVELLRHFRDAMLESSVLGELAVETYYTFGPPVAGVVGESEFLRALARDVIAPLVARVKSLAY